jgi:hypothetical protein
VGSDSADWGEVRDESGDRHRVADGADRDKSGTLWLWPIAGARYGSGSGNGPFGFGCDLQLPSITRKTDKGLPRYDDAGESDVFILTGAEDLVPELVDEGGRWRRASVVARWMAWSTRCSGTGRGSKGCSRGSSVDGAGVRRDPLALDFAGQRHDALWENRREPHRRSETTHAGSSVG